MQRSAPEPQKHRPTQIQADVRTIMSQTFASRHSLRFPRCKRVRWDKSPLDVQTDQDLWDIVESNKGAIKGGRVHTLLHSKHCGDVAYLQRRRCLL